MSSVSTVTIIDTQHQDIVHDTQFDYYGQWIATASSDGTVKIFSAKDNSLVATLCGHEGPVWMLSWAHPRFGNVLATASFDRRVLVWKMSEKSANLWQPVHLIAAHGGSVNAVTWAPQEYGSILASAGSDGTVAVTICAHGSWRESVKLSFESGIAHSLGATGVSFAPFHPSLADTIVLASAGCDNKVRLWRGDRHETDFSFALSCTLDHHSDWVRDVCFNPDGSSSYVVLATCGQDKKVAVTRKPRADLFDEQVPWETSITEFTETAWRLSWSPCGSMLLVTTGESEVFILKEGKTPTDSWIRAPVTIDEGN